LGIPFAIDAFATLRASSLSGNVAGFDGMLLNFRFLEADGVTAVLPVEPTPVSDPAVWGLVGLGLLALVSLRLGGLRGE
jgi:hypothetical protein